MNRETIHIPSLQVISLNSVGNKEQEPGFVLNGRGPVIDVSNVFNSLSYCKQPKAEQCRRCIAKENCPGVVH